MSKARQKWTRSLVSIAEPSGMGQIRYEVRIDGEPICWLTREGDGLLYASQGARAEIDYWRRLDPAEWDAEMGGACTYGELLDAVEAAR